MAETDAQKRATAKYREKTKQFSLKFFPKDFDVYEHLSKQPRKAEYLIGLIRKDMKEG